MANNYYPPVRRSRVEQHSKRKKTNFILNILIGIVFILLVMVGGYILFGTHDEDRQAAKTVQEGENSQSLSNTDENGEQVDSTDQSEGTENASDNPENGAIDEIDQEEGATAGEEDVTEEDSAAEDELASEEGEIITETSNDPNVSQSIVNSAWKPVGTVQTGEHTTQYDEGTTDRKEMEKAIAYATGVSADNMTVWWLERGEVPNRDVIATISPKDQSQTYRVYLQWYDGQGWKPVKLDYLKENDKK
ncbi:DUF1510 family protein [Caldibacillus lycopersici]|uniref:DUF1510 family protein n=1 Tax=Perspicuibacillus lycopersici TaxID=1325689 RepID=A0AAE3LMV3_9BACI|nr:DUF1510 family protein [Perspicuibacillus lycopersici]MCU9613960.1 DUF1510 family protein [Perspicuibacillus lycopersici]